MPHFHIDRPGHRPPRTGDRVVDALRQLLANPWLNAHTRIRAVQNLAELDQRHDNDSTADIWFCLCEVTAFVSRW
jgi:hypothetical protein